MTTDIDPNSIDPDVIRTIIGETSPNDPDGVKAVASVLRNRYYNTGVNYKKLITDPSQFEARTGSSWSNVASIGTDDPKYKAVASVALPILTGEQPPTGNYDAYYSPKGQAALGRSPPSFEDGKTGVDIAGNRFFNTGYKSSTLKVPPVLIDEARQAGHSDSEIYQYLSQSPKYAPLFNEAKAAGHADPDIASALGLSYQPSMSKDDINKLIVGAPVKEGGGAPAPGWQLKVGQDQAQEATEEQYSTLRKLAKANVFEPTRPELTGTAARPYFMASDNDKIDPNWYAVRPNGMFVIPDSKKDLFKEVGTGVQETGQDVTSAIDKYLPILRTQAQIDTDAHDRTATQATPEANTFGGEGSHLATQTGAQLAAGEGMGFLGRGLVAGAEKLAPSIAPLARFVTGAAGAPLADNAPFLVKAQNALVRAGSQATAGAALGAGTSAVIGQDPTAGAVGGAVLPVAGNTAEAVGRKIGEVGSGVLEPFSDSGRMKIIGRFLRGAAEGGPTDMYPDVLVPGVEPTTAQSIVGGNAGLSATERALRNTPGLPNNLFSARDSANDLARQKAFIQQSGTPETLEALEESRATQTLPLKTNALAPAGSASTMAPAEGSVPPQLSTLDAARKILGPDATDEEIAAAQTMMPSLPGSGKTPKPPPVKGPSDSKPVVDWIDGILSSPAGQVGPVRQNLATIRGQLTQMGPDGVPVYETNPAQLAGIRDNLSHLLSSTSESGRTAQQYASKELTGLKGQLDDAIEQGAPGFKDYLSQYAAASKPIDQQKFLQGLGFNEPKDFTANKVDSAIDRAENQRNSGGAKDAKSLTDDQMQFLYNLREDLRRSQQSDYGKRYIGSSTVQNLATSSMMDRLGIPAAVVGGLATKNPLLGAGLAGVRFLHGAQNHHVTELLTDLMLNPGNRLAAALAPEPEGIVSRVMKNRLVNDATTYGALPALVSSKYNPLQQPQ